MKHHKIGEFIATLRKANGYSQQDLGDLLSVSSKTISRWETGNGLPDLTVLPLLAEIFHVTIDELLTGEKSVAKISNDAVKKRINYIINKSIIHLIVLGIIISAIISYNLLMEIMGFLSLEKLSNSTVFLDVLNYHEHSFFLIFPSLAISILVYVIFIALAYYLYTKIKHSEDYRESVHEGRKKLITVFSRFSVYCTTLIGAFLLVLSSYKEEDIDLSFAVSNYEFSLNKWILSTILLFVMMGFIWELIIKKIILNKTFNNKLGFEFKASLLVSIFLLLAYVGLASVENLKLNYTQTLEFNTYREYIDYVEIKEADVKAVIKEDIEYDRFFIAENGSKIASHTVYRDYIVEVKTTPEGDNMLPIVVTTYEDFMYQLTIAKQIYYNSIPVVVALLLLAIAIKNRTIKTT